MAAGLFDVSVCGDLCSGPSMAGRTELEVSGNAPLGASWYSHGDLCSVSMTSWIQSNQEEGTWPLFVELALKGGLKQPAVKDWNWGLGVEKVLGLHCKKPGLGVGVGN